MHDPFPLFKVLIVVLVVLYQGVQALRKRAGRPEPETRSSEEEFPPEDDSPSFPYPAPSQTDPEIPLQAKITPAQTSTAPSAATARSVAQANPPSNPSPAAGLSRRSSLVVPALRDMVLSQVVLAPPPGLRGKPRGRAAPLAEFRR